MNNLFKIYQKLSKNSSIKYGFYLLVFTIMQIFRNAYLTTVANYTTNSNLQNSIKTTLKYSKTLQNIHNI